MRRHIARHARRVVRNPLARSAALLSGATVIGQGAMVLSSPLVTRLYEPVDFGLLAIFIGLLSPLVVVGSLSYQLAVPLPEDDSTAADLLLLSVVIGAGVAAATGVAVVLFDDGIAALVDTPALAPHLWLLPVSLFGAILYQAISAWAVRARHFGAIARTKVTQSLGTILVQIGLGALAVRPEGLLVGDAVGRTAGSGTIAAQSMRGLRPTLTGMSLARLARTARRYRRFPLVSTWSVLFNSASQSAPALMIAFHHGPSAAGWLTLSQRVIAIPMRTIGQSVAQVYVGSAAELARTDAVGLRRLFVDTVKQLFLIGVVPFTMVALLAPATFRVVFGANWSEAGEYSRVLAAMFLVQFVSVPVSQTLNVLERLGSQLLWDALRLLLVVGAFVLTGAAGTSSLTAVAWYAGVLVLAYGVQIAMSYRAIRAREEAHGVITADGAATLGSYNPEKVGE